MFLWLMIHGCPVAFSIRSFFISIINGIQIICRRLHNGGTAFPAPGSYGGWIKFYYSSLRSVPSSSIIYRFALGNLSRCQEYLFSKWIARDGRLIKLPLTPTCKYSSRLSTRIRPVFYFSQLLPCSATRKVNFSSDFISMTVIPDADSYKWSCALSLEFFCYQTPAALLPGSKKAQNDALR